MAISLGAAYVDIVPSTANLAPQLKKQVGEPLAREGTSAGRTFGARFSAGMSSFVSGVGRMVSSAITTATAVAGAGLATALTTGWGRLTTIQDATSALTISLGDATAAAGVLDDVLAVVTDTPFNLDQFARAAQQLVGFGVEAEKVPTYLTAIGEASATQGARAGEFADRLSTVFGQIAASGQVSLADVWRISDAGVNALAILANHFGVTTEEMKKMVSSGAVPATEALDALSKGILEGSDGAAGATNALAGTMEALRETLSGAAGGFRSAMSRMGANIIEPFAGALTTGFTAAAGVLDEIGSSIADAVGNIAESDGFRSFVDWMAEVPSKIGPAIDRLKELGPALAPIGAGVAALGLGGLSSALGPLGALLPAINPIVAAIAAFIAATPELRTAVGEVATALGGAFSEVLSSLVEKLGPELPDISDALVDIGEAFADILIALTPVVPLLADVAILLIDKIGVPVLELLAGAITLIAEALLAMGPALPIVVVGLTGFYLIVKVLIPAVGLLGTMLGLLLSPIGLIIAGLALLTAGVIWAYNNVEWFRDLVDGVGRFLRDEVFPILWTMGTIIGQVLAAAWDLLSNAVSEFWKTAIRPLWEWFRDSLIPTLGRIADIVSERLSGAFSALADSARWVWDNVLRPLAKWFKGSFAAVVNFVADIWDRLVLTIGAIKSLGSGIFKGLVAALDTVISAVKTLIDYATRAVNLVERLAGSGSGAAVVNFVEGQKAGGKSLPGWIPRRHSGGTVPGRPGEETLIVALAGETVLPTHDPSWRLELADAGGGRRSAPLIAGDVYVGSRSDLSELDWKLRDWGNRVRESGI